jgi:hypothetical protein
VPIISNEDTDAAWWEEPQNEVKDVPKGFKSWLLDNSDRVKTAEKRKKLPYWISENKLFAKIGQKGQK